MKMPPQKISRLFPVFVALAMLTFMRAVVAAAQVQITDLGTLGGNTSQARAISDMGQIVGSSYNASGYYHAFIWQNGVMTDLGTLGGNASYAYDINNAGQVTGISYNSSGKYHAFIWQNGVMTDLGTLGGGESNAFAINNTGEVAGGNYSLSGGFHAFIWQNGVMTDLGTLGGNYSWPTAINNTGQVVGASTISSGAQRPFIWQNGVMTDLGTLGGGDSYANAINDAGHVVGYSWNSSGYLAFSWQNGVMTDLGTLGGNFSWPSAINNTGQVVGYSATSSGQHAFIWQNGVMTDLGTLGGNISQATAINNTGQVVGWSTTSSGAAHAFIWQNGVMTDLGTLGGINSQANAVNSTGQVVGWSYNSSNVMHAVLWTIKTGPEISVSPASLAFGSIELPASSTQTVTVSNTSNVDLIVNSISISGANAGSFNQTNNCSTIAPNASCTVTVTFSPTSISAKTAALSIASNNLQTPTVDIPLSGTGIDTIPPSVYITTSNNILWPPNHKMVDVLIGGSATDSGSGIESIVITVSDEYGVYNMTIPGFGSTVRLEAWRDGTDMDGRHYTITAVVTDKAGNQSTATTEVIVPHDMR